MPLNLSPFTQTLGVALPLAYMVHTVPLTLVVGKPILLSSFVTGADADVNAPSQGQIDRAHAAFVTALGNLFEKHQVVIDG